MAYNENTDVRTPRNSRPVSCPSCGHQQFTNPHEPTSTCLKGIAGEHPGPTIIVFVENTVESGDPA